MKILRFPLSIICTFNSPIYTRPSWIDFTVAKLFSKHFFNLFDCILFVFKQLNQLLGHFLVSKFVNLATTPHFDPIVNTLGMSVEINLCIAWLVITLFVAYLGQSTHCNNRLLFQLFVQLINSQCDWIHVVFIGLEFVHAYQVKPVCLVVYFGIHFIFVFFLQTVRILELHFVY